MKLSSIKSKFVLRNIICLVFFSISYQAYSQKNDLTIADKKGAIIFLIQKRELNTSDSNWHDYIKSVDFKQLYKNNSFLKSEIYLFKTYSPHFTYYLLLKQNSETKILECQSFFLDYKIISSFFHKSGEVNGNDLLKILDALFEIYSVNQKSNLAN